MQHNKKTIPEMEAEIRQLQQAMNLPGVHDDERAIYQKTINTIQAAINSARGPVTPAPQAPPAQPIKHNTPPPPIAPASAPINNPSTSPLPMAERAGEVSKPVTNTGETPIYLTGSDTPRFSTPPLPMGEGTGVGSQPATHTSRHIHAGNQTPVQSGTPLTATVRADKETNPYNPTITITWADGYTITVTETEARSRFATTLRDTTELRLAQQGRFDRIWRWSSPWRAVGFYRALIQFIGATPTLAELGIQRPNDVTRTAFAHIVEKAMQKVPT